MIARFVAGAIVVAAAACVAAQVLAVRSKQTYDLCH